MFGALITLGLGVANSVMSAKQAREGEAMRKKAQDAIDNYSRQELTNTLSGVAIPQQEYNLRTEQIRKRTADMTEQAAMAGARGLSMLPEIQSEEALQQEQVNANFEQSLYQLQLMKSQEDARIQSMYEEREKQELAGYGTMLNVGRQDYYNGMNSVLKGVSGLMEGAGGLIGGAYSLKDSLNPDNEQSKFGKIMRGVFNGTPQNYGQQGQGQQQGVTSLPQQLPPSQLNLNEKKWNYSTGTWE